MVGPLTVLMNVIDVEDDESQNGLNPGGFL